MGTCHMLPAFVTYLTSEILIISAGSRRRPQRAGRTAARHPMLP
jgi:hypothetical protein